MGVNRLVAVFIGVSAFSAIVSAQVSRETDHFIQKFSYAATLVQDQEWKAPSFNDLGRTVVSLAKVDDATLIEAFKLLDKNKSYQRTTVGNLLLILIFDIPQNDKLFTELPKIRDGLHRPPYGIIVTGLGWPWSGTSDNTWGLEDFEASKEQVDSLTDRLNYFKSQFQRRNFRDQPVYESLHKAKPL